jgi:HEAT repeat protein
MSKSRIHGMLMIALLLAFTVPTLAQTVASKADEARLIAVLKDANAARKDKADACRQLAIMGSKAAIAPLAAVLGDEELSHNARYALEPNPDTAVDEALRTALGTLKGKPLVGVIGSVGVRRDAKAIGALAKLLGDSEAVVACAAARAMGKVGTAEAAGALQAALPGASARVKLDICEGLFRCAEAMAAADQKEQAVAIYDELLKLEAAHQVRGGALRGAILTRDRGGPKLLRQYLRSNDYILFSAAVQAAQDLPGDRVTKALLDEMKNLPADNQILIIQALGHRGDKAAVPALLDTARSGPKPVRIAALQAVTEMGDAAGVPVFVQLLEDGDREIAQAAQGCLATLPGREADAAVTAMFQSGTPDKQRLALDLMNRRRIKDCMPALLQAARSGDPKTRPDAIKMIGDLGGAEQLPALLELLDTAQTPQDLAAAEQAISTACTKDKDPQAQSQKLAARLAQAKPAQQVALLRVIAAVGGPNSLTAVRALTDSANAEVRTAAIRALGNWRTADAAPDLLTLAGKTTDPDQKSLVVRGYLNLAARGEMSLEQRLQMCRQAAGIIQRDDEKRLLLGTLGNVESPEAMNVILPYLSDPGVRQEAGLAAVTIAERLLRGRGPWPHAAQLVEPLEKVAQATTNEQVAKRAKTLLQQAKSGSRRN